MARSTRTTLLLVTALTGLALLAPSAAIAATPAATTSPNLIKDPGAEKAPASDGSAQVKVPNWTIAKGTQFTSVSYGAPQFPDAKSPGPAARGSHFFTGGVNGAKASATQAISLAAYLRSIRAGKATFTLSAWLGGFSSQDDSATLTVTWQDATSRVLGHTTIGPVKAAARNNVTGMLQRSKSGAVPKAATKAVVTLAMVRASGSYDDGYADNLSLTITQH